MDKIPTVKSSLGGQKNNIKIKLGEKNVYYKQWRHWGDFNKLKTNYYYYCYYYYYYYYCYYYYYYHHYYRKIGFQCKLVFLSKN